MSARRSARLRKETRENISGTSRRGAPEHHDTKAAPDPKFQKRTAATGSPSTAGAPTTREACAVENGGTLRRLLKMPLDILLEVFGHLHPLDLLHLARCTKSLRAILMHRSARAIWKQALSNVPGMPDCPSDLNEPQFANIAFSTHCHECLDTDIEGPMSILWAFRTRLCSSCREPMVSDNDSMSKLPLWNGTCLADLVPAANCSVGKGRRLRFYQWRRYSDMHGVFRDMRTVPDRDQYIAQRKAYMIQYAQDTDRCIEWTDRVLAEIKRAKEERRKARKAMKQERLNAQATIQEGQS